MELSPEEKQRIYEEEKERVRAQKRLKSREFSIGRAGCLLLFLLLFAYLPFRTFYTSTPPRTPTPAQTKVSKVPKQPDFKEDVLSHKDAIRDAMAFFVTDGLIMKAEPEYSKIYVDPYKWKALTYDMKRKTAFVMLKYCALTQEEYIICFVDIYDGYSGKRIAAISLMGFDTYE